MRYKSKNDTMTLTPTEEKIIKCICEEMTDKEIAYTLNKAKRTIEKHKERMRFKLDCKSNVGFTLFAIKNGIFKP